MKINYCRFPTVLSILFILLCHINSIAWAQLSILNPKPGLCNAGVCLANPADEAAFEKANNCVFGSMCGGQAIQASKQCCGIDRFRGTPKPQDKYQKTDSTSIHFWSDYVIECPGKTQNKAAPDALWAQCKVGQKHNPAKDDWNVVIVEKNGLGRDFCIDGCSTPPGIVNKLYLAGVFIYEDKDNPTGAGAGGYGPRASFFNSCAAHDRCYQTCSNTNQGGCDDKLKTDMLAVCATIPPGHETTFINNFGLPDVENTKSKCESAANTMFDGLFAAGYKAFNTRRAQYCQCCQ